MSWLLALSMLLSGPADPDGPSDQTQEAPARVDDYGKPIKIPAKKV